MSSDIEFCVVAADRDVGENRSYPNVVVNQWTECGQANVFYRSPGAEGWRATLNSLRSTNYDLIYLNSMFGTDASLRPLTYKRLGWLADRPVMVAPRGELDSGALSLKSFKKAAFLSVARASRFHRGVFWHATNPREKTSIRGHVGAPDHMVFIAPNLGGRSAAPNLVARPRESGDPLRVAFLSRISPMKNLEFALNILSRLDFPVVFDIYGVIDDPGYWRICQRRIADLPQNVVARFAGEVHPDAVERTLTEYDLFFLPTLGENYGHVIREALSAGVPALISDTTPWRGLADASAGADFPLEDSERFRVWLEAFNRLDVASRTHMRHAAQQMGDDRQGATAKIEANRHMFESVLKLGRGV